MQDRQPSDVTVRIGEEAARADRPREKCPGCGELGPRALGPDDFPAQSRLGVLQAQAEGAALFECRACGKRWGVLRASASAPGAPDPTEKSAPAEKSARRRVRRAVEAQSARAIRRNIKLAGGELPPEAPPGLLPSADERRRARNARKASRKEAR